jgi:molecular chaperone Hsp33
MKNLIRTLICDEQVSLTLADTTQLVQRAQALHGLNKDCTSVLGKFLSAAAFMGGALKEESGEISFALHGDGLGGQINVSGNYALHIRGYVEGAKSVGTEAEILGQNGSFTVIRDDGYSRPFVGSCGYPVEGEVSVEGILEEYYRISEQLPTFFGIVVDFDDEDKVAFAGIAVLQPLPFTDERTIEGLPKGEALCTLVREIAKKGVDEVAITAFSAKKDGIKGKRATYTCNCSRAYLKQVLTSLGEAQMRTIIREDGAVRVHCHYCNTDYAFDDKDADEMFGQ